MNQLQKIEVDDFERRPTKLGNLTHSDKQAEAAEAEALDIRAEAAEAQAYIQAEAAEAEALEAAEAEALESPPQKRSLIEADLKNLYL